MMAETENRTRGSLMAEASIGMIVKSELYVT
jgi:hypothetical protein